TGAHDTHLRPNRLEQAFPAASRSSLENRYPSVGGSRVQISPSAARSAKWATPGGAWPTPFFTQTCVLVSFWWLAATARALVGGVVRDQGVQDRDRIGCVDPAALQRDRRASAQHVVGDAAVDERQQAAPRAPVSGVVDVEEAAPLSEADLAG